jgi:hypothetical protein
LSNEARTRTDWYSCASAAVDAALRALRRQQRQVGVGRDADAARAGPRHHLEELRVEHGLAQALQVQLLQLRQLFDPLPETLEREMARRIGTVVDGAHRAREVAQAGRLDLREARQRRQRRVRRRRQGVGRHACPPWVGRQRNGTR